MADKLTSAQVRMARAALVWTVRDIAEKSGVHRNTITRIESGIETKPRTMAALKAAFEYGGVTFIVQEGEGVGVILKF